MHQLSGLLRPLGSFCLGQQQLSLCTFLSWCHRIFSTKSSIMSVFIVIKAWRQKNEDVFVITQAQRHLRLKLALINVFLIAKKILIKKSKTLSMFYAVPTLSVALGLFKLFLVDSAFFGDYFLLQIDTHLVL